MLNRYVYKNQKKLRCGYTTGTCAAAAAKAAAVMLLSGKRKTEITIKTPSAVVLTLAVEDICQKADKVSCAIRKDSGDDPDVTNHILVYAEVTYCVQGFVVDGGIGVGRITKKGLSREIGMAAINPVPLHMIQNALEEAADIFQYEGGLSAVISVPEGVEIAKKTFNPRLGIEGGISILGTSGIVEPMSEQALLDTIRTEMKMHIANGEQNLLITPGNYGQDFLLEQLHIPIEYSIKCSNYIGDTIDMGCEFGVQGILFVGHIGKLVKLGAGVMNTHSKVADARMETLAACAVLAGGSLELVKTILTCITTDAALEVLDRAGLLKETMRQLMHKIDAVLQHRAGESLKIGAIVFSNEYGVLGKTQKADELLKDWRNICYRSSEQVRERRT